MLSIDDDYLGCLIDVANLQKTLYFQEPDTNQARILRQEPPARARRASGQDWQADATGKSQTRIRPGLTAKTYRQEPDANQARILGREPPARARHASGQDS